MPSLARLLPAARCNVLAMLHIPALPGFFLSFYLFKPCQVLFYLLFFCSFSFNLARYNLKLLFFFLSGTPTSSMGMAEILARVAEETKIYLEAGVGPRPSKFKSLVDNQEVHGPLNQDF